MVRTSRCGRDNPYSVGTFITARHAARGTPCSRSALLLFHEKLECGSSRRRGGSSTERPDYGRATDTMDLRGALLVRRARARAVARKRARETGRAHPRAPQWACDARRIPPFRVSRNTRTGAHPLALFSAHTRGTAPCARGRCRRSSQWHGRRGPMTPRELRFKPFSNHADSAQFWFICFHPKAILRSFAASQAFKVSILRSLQTVCLMRAGHPRELQNLLQCLASHYPSPFG